MLIRSVNPATLKVNKTFRTISSKSAVAEARRSQEAFGEWSFLGIAERCAYVKKLSAALRRNKNEYTKLITIETGKPVTQSLAEIEKCAWTADVYAENAEKWLEEELVVADGKKHVVTFEPLGVVLSIMPWNFPFWQAMRFGIPALCAGNTSVLRHSNVVPMCSQAIADSFKEAGFPDGVFTSIITDYDAVQKLIESSHVNGVSITGSTGAGARIGALAGANIKPCVLELGGSDPFIVLEDAKMKFTCKNAVQGRAANAGQSCIAAKRFVVVEGVVEEFTDLFVRYTQAQRIGDPMDPKTDIGPLANAQQLETLESQVKDAVRKGAKVLTGGKRPKLPKPLDKGYFYEPTVLTKIKPNMKVVTEEVFGPVAPIIVVKDEEEAIRVANSSNLGLGASVWTADLERGERVARRLEAGCVFVNNIVKSDPRMPFGGVKRSGVGRELSHYGLKSFVNVKGINIYG